MDSWVNLDYYIFMKSNGINSSLFRLTLEFLDPLIWWLILSLPYLSIQAAT